MTLIELILLSIGLALDAFAVSIASGSRIADKRGSVRLAFHFGLFQFLMPVAGWFLGWQVVRYIIQVDHWIAFILLAAIGAKMIYESFETEETEKGDPSKGKNLVMLSIATSIDALVVGLSLAMLKIDILYPSVIIGLTAGILSLLGIILSKILSDRVGKRMEIIGGIILIGIGARILVQHLYNW